jgi:hypothetical protein
MNLQYSTGPDRHYTGFWFPGFSTLPESKVGNRIFAYILVIDRIKVGQSKSRTRQSCNKSFCNEKNVTCIKMDPHPNLSYGPRIPKQHSRKQQKQGADMYCTVTEQTSVPIHLPHRHKKLGQYDNSGLRVRITLMRIRPGFSLYCESGIVFKIMPSNDKITYLFLQFDK